MGAPGGGAAAVKPHRTSGGAKGWHPDARERDKVVSQKRQENQHLAVTPGSRNAQQTPARPGNPKRCAAGGRKGSCQGVSSMGFLSRSPKSPRRRPKTLARPSRTRAHRHTGLLVCIQRSRTIGPVQTRPYQLHGAHPQQTSPPFKRPPPALATGCARRGAGRARGWPGAGARVLQVVPARVPALPQASPPHPCHRLSRPYERPRSCSMQRAANCGEVFDDMRAGRHRSSERAPAARDKGCPILEGAASGHCPSVLPCARPPTL